MKKSDTQTEKAIQSLEKSVDAASKTVAASVHILTKINTPGRIDMDEEDESGEGARILQMILAYRLDTQAALQALLQLDHGLMQALGVSSHHTESINIERMAFALGQDDLKQILHALSKLLDSL